MCEVRSFDEEEDAGWFPSGVWDIGPSLSQGDACPVGLAPLSPVNPEAICPSFLRCSEYRTRAAFLGTLIGV